MYNLKTIENLKKTDKYDWFTYIDVINWNEHWRLKSYNNETKTAFIVFKCNNDWENWLNYTAQWCNYNNLIRKKQLWNH